MPAILVGENAVPGRRMPGTPWQDPGPIPKWPNASLDAPER